MGHAFDEVENVTCLQLFKFSSRPFDPNNVAQEFTTNVKIRVFSGKKDLFDDLFQSKSSLKEILQEAQSRLSLDDLRKFNLYRERRLASIPLEGLRVATREPTPSISLSENSSASRSKSSAAKQISKHRPRQKIIALSPILNTYRYLTLVWGVIPFLIGREEFNQRNLEQLIKNKIKLGLLKKSDKFIIVDETSMKLHEAKI